MGGRPDTDDVRLAVTGEVLDDAVGSGDAPVVQHRLLPTLAASVRRLKDRELETWAAEPADDLVAAVAVDVPHSQSMAVVHRVFEHDAFERLVFRDIAALLRIEIPKSWRGCGPAGWRVSIPSEPARLSWGLCTARSRQCLAAGSLLRILRHVPPCSPINRSHRQGR